MKNGGSWLWPVIGAFTGFVLAWITIVNFIVQPMESRIERGRDLIREVLRDQNTRIDYLQRQIDELERGRAP
jgi:type II secretory pathway component PulM